jgi:hypothetical protein
MVALLLVKATVFNGRDGANVPATVLNIAVVEAVVNQKMDGQRIRCKSK